MKRLDYLDALRGIGALVVAACHFASVFGLDRWGERAFQGFAMVSMFFVLSGFVLSRKYTGGGAGGGGEPMRLGAFMAARFCRLWIPFAAVVILAIALQQIPARWATSPAMSSEYAQRWYEKAAYANLMSWGGLVHVLREINPLKFYSGHLLAPSWTLMPEMIMACWLPFGLLIIRRSVCWFILGTAVAYRFNIIAPTMIPFALGVLLAKYEERMSRIPLAGAYGILLAYAAIYVMVPLDVFGLDINVFWALPSACLIAAVLSCSHFQAAGNHPVMAYVGRVSFGIYLLHWPLMFVLGPPMLAGLNKAGMSGLTAWWITIIAFLAIVIGLANLFWYAVERPAINLGKWIGRRGVPPAPGLSPAVGR